MQKLEEWVERRINEDYEEDDVQPIHEGNGD
jgi:hypothetical protein